MNLEDLTFRRRFSQNNSRKLKLDCGEMNFEYDFTSEKRGSLHPVLESVGDVTETVRNGTYEAFSHKGGAKSRLIGQFFPYYTYSVKIEKLRSASVGISILGESVSLSAMLGFGKAKITLNGELLAEFPAELNPCDIFEITFRAGGISLYRKTCGKALLIGDLTADKSGKIEDLKTDGLFSLLSEQVYKKANSALTVDISEGGTALLSEVSASLYCGIAEADIRPIKYEDGTPIAENGRVFLTASERLETGCYQSVLSWNPTTSDFKLEGALFFDLGDGKASNDVASSIVFDRRTGEWYIWFCAFSHGHVLARARVKGDPRFGISVIDAVPMQIRDGADKKEFLGFFGDEDPDLAFIDGKWNLTICRPEDDGYHYYRFVSDSPLDGFVFRDRTGGAEKTGGSFVKFENGYYFVCGSDFKKRSVYDVYKYDDFSNPSSLKICHSDGGFRGWGSVFGIYVGTRKRYFFITFDRMLAAKNWNWSYGNLYAFMADEYFS